MEQSDLPDRQGMRWEEDEEERLKAGFISGLSIGALATAHQRRRGAIRQRLIKIGLIQKERLAPNSPFDATISAWTYLILSERGEVYLGATTNIRNRLRSHNSNSDKQWTKGRRWHLLALKRFSSRREAFEYESFLKRNHNRKCEWKLKNLERAKKIVLRYQYKFSVDHWAMPIKRRDRKI